MVKRSSEAPYYFLINIVVTRNMIYEWNENDSFRILFIRENFRFANLKATEGRGIKWEGCRNQFSSFHWIEFLSALSLGSKL